MNSKEEKLQAFERLLDIMDELRLKCPWDREQTIDSLRNLTIEETYELADAIMEKDLDDMKKELGDLMLHIVFYAKIASENKQFDMGDVLKGINEKLVFRHPHVFGDTAVGSSGEVIQNWEELKKKEGNKQVLGGVPKTLPALIKAHRIQDKARAVGFDWEKREDVWFKVNEEMEELKAELALGDQDRIEDEFGDLFFSIVNAARLYNIEPETALERTNRKFIHRFNHLEAESNRIGKSLKEMSLQEMEAIWQQAKEQK